MKPLHRDAIVGFTALLGVVGLGITLIMFGELSFIRPQRYELTVVLPDAKGLSPNAGITLNGVDVGRVGGATTGTDPTQGVTLTLRIDDGVRIPRDVRLVVQRGLLGESSLSLIVPLRGLDAEPLPDDAFLAPGERFLAEANSSLEELTAQLDARLGGVADAATSITRLADTYTALGEELRTLVDPDDAAGDETTLRETLARLNNALDSADTWLADDELRTGAADTVREARHAFERLGAAAGRLEQVGETIEQASVNAGEDLDEGVSRFVVAAESMTAALEEIRVVAQRVNSGEGTLGLLIVNPDLFRNLNDAAERLDKALLEAQLLLEKYRREGVPIQF